jgi:hypothetical protein
MKRRNFIDRAISITVGLIGVKALADKIPAQEKKLEVTLPGDHHRLKKQPVTASDDGFISFDEARNQRAGVIVTDDPRLISFLETHPRNRAYSKVDQRILTYRDTNWLKYQ